MEFSIPPRVERLLPSVREFIASELYPLELSGAKQSFRELLPVLEAKRNTVKKKGWWAPQLPERLGGMGLSFMEHAILSEELGRTPFGHFVFNCQAPDAGNMEILQEFGTPEQQERWLTPLARGAMRSCFSMTEPEFAGSNPVWMKTSARRDGDHYVIDGHKWFTSSADGAGFAIVMAVTNPDAPPHLRASQIIVPTDTPGFRLVRNIPCMGHEGDGWNSHSEIRYEQCRVPAANLLGGEGAGFAIAQARLGPGRIHHCMRWIGISERALEMLCRRAAERELAPGDRLGSRQTIQNWIAESRCQVNAARLMVLHAGWKIDQLGAKEAREDISLIKFFVAGVMQEVVDRAIQTHGALGITDDTVLSWFYRQERAARIYDGPDEVHKSVVAKRILKRYGLSLK